MSILKFGLPKTADLALSIRCSDTDPIVMHISTFFLLKKDKKARSAYSYIERRPFKQLTIKCDKQTHMQTKEKNTLLFRPRPA